jgi:hypothetical protein
MFAAAILVSACATKQSSAPAASPASSTSADLPIAQYLGSDDATGSRVFELLRDGGIKSSAGGSLGYSVWVSGADRAKARQILLSAADRECLPISIFDDQGQALPNSRPPRCPSLMQPNPAGSSAK